MGTPPPKPAAPKQDDTARKLEEARHMITDIEGLLSSNNIREAVSEARNALRMYPLERSSFHDVKRRLDRVIDVLQAKGHKIRDDEEKNPYDYLIKAHEKKKMSLPTLIAIVGATLSIIFLFVKTGLPSIQGGDTGNVDGKIAGDKPMANLSVALVASDAEADITHHDLAPISNPTDAWKYLRKRSSSLSKARETSTDDEGRFHFGDVKVGSYYILVTTPKVSSPCSWYLAVAVKGSRDANVDLNPSNAICPQSPQSKSGWFNKSPTKKDKEKSH